MLQILKSHIKEYLTAALLLSLLLLICYCPVLAGNFIYVGDIQNSDLLDLNLPFRYAAAQNVKEGCLPFYSKVIGNGFAILEEGQAGPFYPATLLFFTLFSVPTASNLSILTSFLIAGLGMYLFAKINGLKPAAAFFSAVIFAFTPIIVFRLKHLNMLQVMVWQPWTLACVQLICRQAVLAEKADKNKLLMAALGLGLGWGLQMLAGHPHMGYVCGAACIFYTAILAVSYYLEFKPQNRFKVFKTAASYFIAAGLLGLSVGAVQLLPTAYFAASSTRSHAYSWKNISTYPMNHKNLYQFLSPFIIRNPADYSHWKDFSGMGTYWESMTYIGVISLFMIAFAFKSKNKYRLYCILTAAIVMYLLAMGTKGGLYYIPWKFFPGFNKFRFPQRFLIAFGCFASLLAGLGLTQMLNAWANDRKKQLITAAAAVLILFADFCIINNKYVAYLPNALFETPRSAQFLKEKGVSRISVPELMTEYSNLVRAKGWKKTTDTVGGLFHCLCLNSSAFWDIYSHNTVMMWVGGMSTKEARGLQDYTKDVLDIPDKLPKRAVTTLTLSDKAKKILRMQNVSHLLSLNKWQDSHNKKLILVNYIKEPGLPKSLKIYKLNDPKPRLQLAAQARLTEPHKGSPKAYFDKYLNTINRGVCCLEKTDDKDELAELESCTDAQKLYDEEKCEILQDKNAYLEARFQTVRPRVAYFPENYSQNWQAELDGEPVSIYKANYAFMACVIPPGTHTLTLRYRPFGFTAGAILSIIGLLSAAAVFVCACRKQKD
ncbi:YfhO family protein [bacterium]|nr:YfhO family protein [bacterium]